MQHYCISLTREQRRPAALNLTPEPEPEDEGEGAAGSQSGGAGRQPRQAKGEAEPARADKAVMRRRQGPRGTHIGRGLCRVTTSSWCSG